MNSDALKEVKVLGGVIKVAMRSLHSILVI